MDKFSGMGKYKAEERALIKSIGVMLTIKRIPDSEIINRV